MASPKPSSDRVFLRQNSQKFLQQSDELEEQQGRHLGRASLDLPQREHPVTTPIRAQDNGPLTNHRLPIPPIPRVTTPSTMPRQRPVSMGPHSPSCTHPAIAVDSPLSPSKEFHRSVPSSKVHAVTERLIPTAGLSSQSPHALPTHHTRTSCRSATPAPGPRIASMPGSVDSVGHCRVLLELSSTGRDGKANSVSMPPPVNRIDKPRVPTKPVKVSRSSHAPTLSPPTAVPPPEDKVSPFSTPPSSEGSPTTEDVPPPRGKSHGSDFQPPPVHHSIVEKRREQDAISAYTSPSHDPRLHGFGSRRREPSSLSEHRPGLPPRQGISEIEPKAFNTSRVLVPPATVVMEPTSKSLPPQKRNTLSGTTQSFKDQLHLPSAEQTTIRRSGDFVPPYTTQRQLSKSRLEDSGHPRPTIDGTAAVSTDFPDFSQANRRRPCFKEGAWDIHTRYDTRLFDICGQYVCTTGYLTKVWDILSGEQLMSMSHGETIKITSLAFKPGRNADDEGKRLWLGTNSGEIQEVDIQSQSVIFTKTSAHPRREVIKIYRRQNEMWTLDDEGKLHIWPPDENGLPNLQYTHTSFRVPKGHTFSLIVSEQLWFASGKEIRVFQPSARSDITFQVLQRPLNQPGVGEVTSGAVISSQLGRIYFGHIDGKVTIYATTNYSCLGIVNVSVYKINSLAGAGEYLWAGYNTGMIYVYDTNSHPWKVKKDWCAHETPVASILVDRSSIWKLGRLQVASLGNDNAIRVWDGMLEDDWLGSHRSQNLSLPYIQLTYAAENEMQAHDVEYCTFREVKAVVVTWNAGASTPTSLRQDERDANFFREVLQSEDPPDILVFGFQELVDLEDKKLTAKSFFKGSKKKDSSEQEHMSRQYRAWRDHITRCIEDYMPSDQPYHLLHTASLVGLFTCVFVKQSEHKRVRNINGSEVKRGMGGLHGNKGALILRFLLDDSSICFINCHLAAGQTQTVHRNNDIAAILETDTLPAERDPSLRIDMFVGGGDGTLILDHEICILNGDLNYRIDTMGRDTVVNAVKTNNLGKLLERDQLLLSRKRNPGFRLRAFSESPVTFSPTYKYDVGTDNYDSSEKRRSPAWCDRILYRGVGRIKQTEYRRHEVRASDHRPVSGTFKFRIKTITPIKRVKVWEECERRFEEVKQRLATEAKVDYLVNVLGIEVQEAQSLIKT
ncbi:MAG: hypothetical protein M1830_010477 [Pleopsidium flavum]|nr:MAG: hypothetical protein M1830_010477 [Pleopsidium flavum]